MKTRSRKLLAYCLTGCLFSFCAIPCSENDAVADDTVIAAKLTDLGGQLTQTKGVVTKAAFMDSSKMGADEHRLEGQLTSLKGLSLGRAKGLTDETLPLLASLTSLEELSIEGMQVSDAGLVHFTPFTSLRSLALFHPSFGMKGFDGSGFAALKSLPKLEKLTVAGTPFNDRGMTAIAEITQLRDFRTWHTYQTQAGNKQLTKLPHLRSLWIGQRLRQYNGSSNALSLDDSTLDVLVSLKTLEALTLNEAQFSLTALLRLKELPKLKKLDLRTVDISQADVDQLRAALPQVSIDWKPLTDEEQQKLTTYLKSNK